MPSGVERQPDLPARQPAAARAAARCGRAAGARRDPTAARLRLRHAAGVLLVVRPRPRRHGRALPPLAALAAEPCARRPPGDAQHVGGGVFRPRRGHAHRARRSGREGGRGALCARRRLVPPAPRRHEGPGRLDRRPRGVAQGLDALAEHVHAWACSSACGSSRRWSTSTPIARASTQTGSSPRPRPCRAARTSHTARSMCSIWPTPMPTAMCAGRWPT